MSKVNRYIDSVGGKAHQSAVEIIDSLEKEIANKDKKIAELLIMLRPVCITIVLVSWTAAIYILWNF